MRAIAAVLVVCLMTPSRSTAQDRSGAAVHVGWSQSLPSSMPMFGLSIESYDGYRAFRLGGAAGFARGGSITDTARSYIRQWAGDADVIFAPANIHEVAKLLHGLEPEVFAGVGLQGARDPDGGLAATPVSSVGASMAARVARDLRGRVEMRYRMPMAASGEGMPTFTNGWDVRFAIAYQLGGESLVPIGSRHIVPGHTYVTATGSAAGVREAAPSTGGQHVPEVARPAPITLSPSLAPRASFGSL